MYTKCSKSTKKGVQWIHCDYCNYKSKSENTFKKRITTKHKNNNTCTMCEKQFDSERSFEAHKHNDHNPSTVNVSLNTNNDLDIRLEQLEVEECGEGESDVSIDEERMEALDREMNPGDYN